MQYDFLIVGAGLFGSTFARIAQDDGYSCLVIDKRQHIAGNCYTENIAGINVHKYGPHIFHTNDERIWQFINRFSSFNGYSHRVKVNYKDRLYSFPINLFTLYQVANVKTPEEAIRYLESVRVVNTNPKNLEEWILDKCGRELYEIFVEGYTTKQWDKHPRDLPASIIKRIPIRKTFDDRYFSDNYEGLPTVGYTKLVENMLDGIKVILDEDYLTSRDEWDKIAKKVVYTGPIDEFFNSSLGKLDWRSLRFEQLYIENCDFQGTSIVNYTDVDVKHTRIVEYKHFDKLDSRHTVITKEFPQDYEDGLERFYPVNTTLNNELFGRYQSLIDTNKFIFGGRLAEYRYYDMHQVIASAIHKYNLLKK
jgi:UDP-galactopyranose mutase